MQKPTPAELQKLRAIADYQFGKCASSLFPENIKVLHSRTKRIRYIFSKNELLATLRAQDGFFSLTIAGANKLREIIKPPKLRVVIRNDVAPFIKQGRSVFAKHIVKADSKIRPMEEVIIVDQNDNLVGVGKALLTGREMLRFKSGVAVKTRHGAGK